MSESRKDVLLKALEAEVGGATVDLGSACSQAMWWDGRRMPRCQVSRTHRSSPPSVRSHSRTS